MSEREIMNSKHGIPLWWRPNLVFLKEEWSINPNLKHFQNNGITSDPKKCECSYPNLVELCEHDFCIRGRIDSKVCVRCNQIHSFTIIR